MLKIYAPTTGIRKVDANVKAYEAQVRKAHLTAMKVEGNRLRIRLKKDIQSGVIAGRRMQGLSLMARTREATKSGGLRANRPLRRLHIGVRYFTPKLHPNEVHVGWVGPRYSSTNFTENGVTSEGYNYDRDTGRGEKGWHRNIAVSGSWRGLAKILQEGFERDVTQAQREYLAWYGSQVDRRLFGGRKSRRRNVFFLRKETTRMRTPARPILEPFWAAHRSEAKINIKANFRRKMRGETIGKDYLPFRMRIGTSAGSGVFLPGHPDIARPPG